MLNVRLQVLISSAERSRLEDEARRRGTSVAAVVREAIDVHLAAPTREDRRAALAAISRMKGTVLPPDELEALIGEANLQAALGE